MNQIGSSRIQNVDVVDPSTSAEIFAYVMDAAKVVGIEDQAALARRLDVTRAAISNWKGPRGIPASALVKISAVIRKSLDEIVTCGRVSPAVQLRTPGDRIRVLRLSRGLERAQLAAALGFAEAQVAAWEDGTSSPDFQQLVKVCDYFPADYRWVAVGEQQPAVAAHEPTRMTHKVTAPAKPRR